MIIDSNVIFGFEILNDIDLSLEKIIKIMNDKYIDKALITNIKCKYYDLSEGNNETADIIKKYPDRFYGMLSFNLSHFIDIEKEVERGIYELGLSCIRFFNTDSNFTSGWGSSFGSLTMEKILRKISGSGIPVFIEGGYPFKDIRELAARYGEIPVIASGAGYGNLGEAIIAAGDSDNLYLEISTLDSMDGVATLVEQIGDKKIIFGSGMPYNSPSCEILAVKYAGISRESKERIFSGNILDILNSRRVKQR